MCELIVSFLDIVVVMIGVGFCGWIDVVYENGLVEQFMVVFSCVQFVVCGLKVYGVIQQVGFIVDWVVELEIFVEVGEYFMVDGVVGWCIVIQYYGVGVDGFDILLFFCGVDVVSIIVYCWGLLFDLQFLYCFVVQVGVGEVDVVLFMLVFGVVEWVRMVVCVGVIEVIWCCVVLGCLLFVVVGFIIVILFDEVGLCVIFVFCGCFGLLVCCVVDYYVFGLVFWLCIFDGMMEMCSGGVFFDGVFVLFFWVGVSIFGEFFDVVGGVCLWEQLGFVLLWGGESVYVVEMVIV